METEHRRAARLVVVDSGNQILLFQYARATGERYWATPGGGLEAGETFEEAGAREAAEELGLEDARLTRLSDKTVDFVLGDRLIHQHERFFLLHNAPKEFGERVREVHSREGILQTRWWSLAELDVTGEKIFPEDLRGMLKRAVGPSRGEIR